MKEIYQKNHKIIFKCVKIMPEMYNAISRSHPECCHINHFQNVTFITNIKKIMPEMYCAGSSGNLSVATDSTTA